MLPMRDRSPLCATWPERLTKAPFALTLSMKLGDFIEVLEQTGQRPWPGGSAQKNRTAGTGTRSSRIATRTARCRRRFSSLWS
jgi:hypothetical protein